MAATNTNYNLKEFENREARIRIAPQPKQKKQFKNLAAIKTVVTCAIFISLIVSLLYSRSLLTEVMKQIAERRNALVQVESEITYMQFSNESSMSITNVEQYGVEKLGMTKTDPSQVVYVTLKTGNEIEVLRGKQEVLLQQISNGLLNTLSYMAP